MINLNEKYNPETFATFLRDFLPEDFEEKEQDIADVSKCKVIKMAREIGHCPSLEVTVLEMEHDKETDPRVAIATDAFKLLALYGIDKALVIFNNKESDNYRFSYLTIKLDLDENSNVKKTYSNARRYSFFLGAGAKVKTPEQQLIKKGRVKDVEDLLSRFSLEVVNKQFYLEVAKHFDELVKTDAHFLELPFQSNPNVRKNFAMRLVGRLMFCWFLKQKRSEQGQLIPDEILSANAVSDNYYHKTLEPLFFEVLNTQIDSRDIRSDLYDKVPYLNGGLFSPQTDDYYELDRATFASRHINTLKVSDKWFKAFFDLLETYNFTIDENTVFDQELSVDPEMLGRIFENLLAEINPETGSSERKRTGSFYTPRQIVEYMVDQSLLEYLKTKTGIEEEKLQALISYDLDDDSRYPRTEEEDKKIVDAIETLKVLDPACGSGAFPIGTLQKIVWILQNVDPDCKLWLEKKLAGVPDLYRQKIINEVQSNPFDYTRKLDVIKNSIFGVDIQPIAVEISRLRCFLTLVVESEIHDSKQNRGIEPLPNLDFKFVCANTLVGLPKSEEKGLFEDHSGVEELARIMSDYFSASRTDKEAIKNRFHSKQKELLKFMIDIRATSDRALKLTLWDPFSNKSNPWFDPEWMYGITNKFDVLIGNPPYIKEYIDRSAFDGVREHSCYQGKMDLWYLFACTGIDLLEQNGILSFIAQNNWVTSAGASKMRNKVVKETQIVSLVDFGAFKVFETAGIQTMVLIFRKDDSKEEYQLDYRRLIGNDLSINDANDTLQHQPNMHAEYFQPSFIRENFIDKKLTFSDSKVEKILNKMIEKNNFKLTEKEVANGIHHHHDRVNKDRQSKLYDKFIVGDGIFVLSNHEKESIGLNENEASIVKPSYTTKELKKWYGNSENQEWVIYTDSSFKNEEKMTVYPNLKNHLDQFRDVITSSNKPYGLHRARVEDFFKGEKIIATRKCTEPTFTYTDFDCYVSATFYVIKTTRLNQKYLTGLLNSKLFAFWLRHKGKMQGANYQVDKEPLLELPIFTSDKDRQNNLIKVVDQIIEVKKGSVGADTSQYEKELDELVFDLYDLTEEEKEIVRNS